MKIKNILFCLILIHSFLFSQHLKFAWLTDTHIGNSSGEDDLRNSINDIIKRNDLNFVILSGDITESGRTKDFLTVKNILSTLDIPFYIIPGNHDTKWSESGGEEFKTVFGDDRFIFNKHGIYFIGLHQGPILRMADGYFAQEDLRWLKTNLKKINNSNPIIFIAHYPIDSSISNWYEFLEIIKNKNVKAILVGHGHNNMILDFAGIYGIMGRSNLSSNRNSNGYTIVELKNDSLFFSERKCSQNIDSLWHKIPFVNSNKNKIQISKPAYDENKNYPNVKINWVFDSKFTITSEPVKSEFGILCSNRNSVFLLNEKNGKLIWKFLPQGAVFGAVAYSNDKVFFGTTKGIIYSLNAKNGKLIWSKNIGLPIVSVPYAISDILYLGSSGKFFAININDGNIIWEFPLSDGFVESRPSIYNEKIIFGAWDTYLYCLNRFTGKLLWKWSNGKPNVLLSPAVCYPVITNNKVFIVAPDRALTVINLLNGETIYRTKNNYVREAIGVSSDSTSIFVKSMYDSVFVYKILNDSLSLSWFNDLKYGYDFAPSYPIEKDGNLFFSVKNGYVFSLNSLTGILNWKYRVSDCLNNNILPLNAKSIIITSMNGKVYNLIEKH